MKFSLPVALLVAVGVSAQTPSPAGAVPSTKPRPGMCEAEYIVERCLETEQPKATACEPTDYECQCAAYEAIATCYNNCPGDPRAPPAQNQVIVFCQQVTLTRSLSSTETSTAEYDSSTDTYPTALATSAGSRTTERENRVSNTATFSSEDAEETGAAPELMRNTGGMLLVIAGVVAVML